MAMQLVLRFDYGHIVPWVKRHGGVLVAIAGPDAVYLDTPVRTRGERMTTVADFTVAERESVPFVLTWHPSHLPRPRPVDARAALDDTDAWWRSWSLRSTAPPEVQRSLITLKALTYAPTGGLSPPDDVAARAARRRAQLDYRFCWLRDATLTLLALLSGGYVEEAAAWRDWLLRAIAGRPHDLQIMYGPAGERRLTELELDWLPGYEGSRPVRVGNAASAQFQLDVYGEVMDALLKARDAGMEPDTHGWAIQRALLVEVERVWREPDEGIWEVRGPRRHFVHSKVMAWVAFDRAVQHVERHGLEGPVDTWRELRDEVHADVCRRGFDRERNTFTQSYGARALDAALLLIPTVGFLPGDDPRVIGTVEAVQRELMDDGFVLRYPTDEADDGLPPGEGAFLPCSFWLVDALCLIGRRAQADELFARLVALANDVVFCLRSTIRAPDGSSATSRRRSPTSGSSTACSRLKPTRWGTHRPIAHPGGETWLTRPRVS